MHEIAEAFQRIARGGATVEVVRVEYDLDRARKAILESDLPDDFAEYLATGGKLEG